MTNRSSGVIGAPSPLDLYVTDILETLHLSIDDEGLRQRVGMFIRCNGYKNVLKAAKNASERHQRSPLDDPWAYTVSNFNNNLAQLAHLYLLIHWTECGLRSHLDLEYRGLLNPNWYRDPNNYLPPERITGFVKDKALGLKWHGGRRNRPTNG